MTALNGKVFCLCGLQRQTPTSQALMPFYLMMYDDNLISTTLMSNFQKVEIITATNTYGHLDLELLIN